MDQVWGQSFENRVDPRTEFLGPSSKTKIEDIEISFWGNIYCFFNCYLWLGITVIDIIKLFNFQPKKNPENFKLFYAKELKIRQYWTRHLPIELDILN